MRAWRPDVPGVREVLHAHFTDHAYPAHAHGDWTLMLVDTGAVAYTLGRRDRIADATSATLLPPGVPHDGRAAPRSAGFRKRVVYLDATWLPEAVVGGAVDAPTRVEALAPVRALHAALAAPGDELEAENLLALIAAGFAERVARVVRSDAPLAARLRDLLEARLTDGLTLAAAGELLGSHPSHLSRAFSAAYGMPPHQYVMGRRVDAARRRLLDGASIADAAAASGFYDQAHLTRQFARVLGTTPARFRAA